MTYCFAWKTEDEIYIVADSVTSSKKQDIELEADYSSMGEKYGEYDSHFIAETDTKIYVKDNIILAFSGGVNTYEEIKNLVEVSSSLTIDQLIVYIQGIISNSEIILAIKQINNNQLFVINANAVREVLDYVSIGSGKNIKRLDSMLIEFFNTFPDLEDELIEDKPRKKISAATAYLQMNSLKNNYLKYGVGGVICGICIYDNKIEWNDDLLYFFYDENFENKKLINVLIRNNNILTGSDFTGLTKLFRVSERNKLTDVQIRKLYRTIHKDMASHIPRYIVFYSFELNNIFFYDTHKETQTSLVRIFQRRGKIKSKNEIFTIPFLTSEFLLKYNNKTDYKIPFHYLEGLPVPYVSRDTLIENTENIEDIEFEYDYFDFPLETVEIKIEKDIEQYFKLDLIEYENLIIINFDYFEKKNVELKDFYKELNVDFGYIELLKKLKDYFMQEWDISKFEILVFGINPEDLSDEIKGLENIIIENEIEYVRFIYKLLHSYYTDSKYFHLNKIFIIDDSSMLNDFFKILPDYNKFKDEADIFMIKNPNYDSEVLYSPFYYDADLLFTQLAGLSLEAIGLWSPSEYSVETLNDIKKYINEQIEDSKYR